MDSNFDIAMRENDFLLYVNEKPLLTPSGKEVVHPNARLLRQAAIHEMMQKGHKISPLGLLMKLIDTENISFDIKNKLATDPLLINHSYIDIEKHKNPILINQNLTNFIFINASSLNSALANFVTNQHKVLSRNEYIIQQIEQLSQEKKVTLEALIRTFEAGVIVHLLLINGYLSVSEYAAGIVLLWLKMNNEQFINLFRLKGENGLSEAYVQISNNAVNALNFLSLCKDKNQNSVIEEIIQRGEDDRTEFKSTLRWDIRQEKKNPAIEHASLKTICAFLNSEGGDLLIGVRDDGNIEGFETDQFSNDDRFLLHLWMLIKTCMGNEVVEWVKTTIQKFGDKTVCRVHCNKSKKPIFLRQKGFDEAIYIRTGPSSSSLEISSALKYIEQHF